GLAVDGRGLVLDVETQLDLISRAGSLSFLLGAGISRAAGIPLASEIITSLGGEILGYDTATTPDVVWNALAAKPFFRPAAPYAWVLEARFSSQRARADYFEHLIIGKQPTVAHRCIAALLRHGYGSIVTTTNFDRLMEYAVLSTCDQVPVVSLADSF